MKCYAISLVVCLSLISSCKEEGPFNGEIDGQWFSIDWTSQGQSDAGKRAWMSLNPDSTYRAIIIRESQSGTYSFAGRDLILNEETGQTQLLRIESLRDDTLVVSLKQDRGNDRVTFVRRNR